MFKLTAEEELDAINNMKEYGLPYINKVLKKIESNKDISFDDLINYSESVVIDVPDYAMQNELEQASYLESFLSQNNVDSITAKYLYNWVEGILDLSVFVEFEKYYKDFSMKKTLCEDPTYIFTINNKKITGRYIKSLLIEIDLFKEELKKLEGLCNV